MDDLSPIFDALGSPHRREIVNALTLQPHSISRLAEMRGLSLPAIHKHIRVLEEAGMVQRRKVGRTNYLALRREPLTRLHEWVDRFQPWWGTDSETLQNYTEYLDRHPNKEETT